VRYQFTQRITQVIFLLISLLLVPTSVHATVTINEIFPKSSDIKYTWFELYNTGPTSVSLDRWKLETNSSGSFTLNASAIIEPNNFLVFYQTQTGITFSVHGDTLKLLDNTNTLVDTQSYPGILGYNTSMGRVTDGTGAWTICTPAPDYMATAGKPNKCPPPPSQAPTPTPTTIINSPTNTSSPSPRPYSSSPTPSMHPTTTNDADILNYSISPTPTSLPTDFRASETYKNIWIATLSSGIGIGILILGRELYRKFRR
jgi:predicted extracellular nuclease